MKHRFRLTCLFLLVFALTAAFASAQEEIGTFEETMKLVSVISPEFQKLLDSDFSQYTDKELIEAFITVSSNNNRKDELLDFYETQAKAFDESLAEALAPEVFKDKSYESQYLLADTINQQMHRVFLRRYNKNSFTFADLKDTQSYDCVSASLLYAALLTRCGIPCGAIETSDHVLIKVMLDTRDVFVETTNFYGFDPGSKKEFQSNFGKATGFTYVAPGRYKLFDDLPMKKLLALVIQNDVYIKTKAKNYLEATNLAYILQIIRNDESGNNSYSSAFTNLANYMSRENNKLGRYEESFKWIQDLPQSQNKRAMLNNTYLAAVNAAEKADNYQIGYDALDLSLNYGVTQKNGEYIRFRLMLTNNSVVKFLDAQKFDEARKLIFSEMDAGVLSQSDLLKLYRSVTVKECNLLYNQKEYKQAIEKTLDCLEYMPKDKVLVSNLKVYYLGYVDYLKTNAKPSEIKAVIAEAQKRFPNEKAFQDLTGESIPY